MDVIAPTWRKIAVMSGSHRIDIALPLDETLGGAVRRLGVTFTTDYHVIMDGSGTQVDHNAIAADLEDGALFSIVNLADTSNRERSRSAEPRTNPDSSVAWWGLATIGLVASVMVIASATASVNMETVAVRAVAAAVFGLGAVGSSVVRVLRTRVRGHEGEIAALVAPISLSFAAGALSISPTMAGSGHLAVASGLLAAGVLAALLKMTSHDDGLVATVGTVAVLLLGFAVIWGATFLLSVPASAAAALSVGVVPIGLRFLPSTLVNVADGHHIDFRHFMTSRWTVRGVIPEEVRGVDTGAVKSVVASSTTRMAAGVVVVSIAAAVFYPFAPPVLGNRDVFVTVGSITLSATLVLSLILVGRHYATPALRWIPRAAAGVILLELAFAIGSGHGDLVSIVSAGGLLVAGFVAAITMVPISRGAASLSWSRLADGVEGTAVALSLPAALLAGDALTLLRGVMS